MDFWTRDELFRSTYDCSSLLWPGIFFTSLSTIKIFLINCQTLFVLLVREDTLQYYHDEEIIFDYYTDNSQQANYKIDYFFTHKEEGGTVERFKSLKLTGTSHYYLVIKINLKNTKQRNWSDFKFSGSINTDDSFHLLVTQLLISMRSDREKKTRHIANELP